MAVISIDEGGTPAKVYLRQPRPTGTPPRCVDCGAICTPAHFGQPRCQECAMERFLIAANHGKRAPLTAAIPAAR